MTWLSRVGILTCTLAALVGLWMEPRSVAAQSGDWEHVSTADLRIQQLIWTRSGELVARTQDDAWSRSQDGGETWLALAGPPGGRILAVSPADSSTVYGLVPAGLLRTTDSGASWSSILRTDVLTGFDVSPLDPRVLFVRADGHVRRSRDGGASWETLEDAPGHCPTELQAHTSDAQRVLLIDMCRQQTGRDATNPDIYALMLVSPSGASGSWTTLRPRGGILGPLAGAISDPNRFYAVRADYGHASLETVERTDDGGASWNRVARLVAYSRSDPNVLSFDPDDVLKPPSLLFPADALALLVDPVLADQVYVGLGGVTSSGAADAQFGAVLASGDGGASWDDLGLHGQGAVTSLALDPDVGYLYAGTQHGIWRMRTPT